MLFQAMYNFLLSIDSMFPQFHQMIWIALYYLAHVSNAACNALPSVLTCTQQGWG